MLCIDDDFTLKSVLAFEKDFKKALSTAKKAAKANDYVEARLIISTYDGWQDDTRELTQKSFDCWEWTLEQFEQFIAYADKSGARLAFNILFWTGIREGELLALTPADFLPDMKLNIDKNFAVLNGDHIIKNPKNEPSIQCIAIPQFLYEDTMNYINGLYGLTQTDRLFMFTRSFLQKEIKRIASKAGLEPIRVYDLRYPNQNKIQTFF